MQGLVGCVRCNPMLGVHVLHGTPNTCSDLSHYPCTGAQGNLVVWRKGGGQGAEAWPAPAL